MSTIRLQFVGRRRDAQGFSLVEVLIAMFVLMIGLLALLALFGQAVASTQFAQQDLIAKQKAREQLEAIYSARDDNLITFTQIGNIGAGLPGIFKTGFNPLLRVTPGTNAILGTNDPAGVITPEGPTADYLLAPDAAGNLVDALGNPLNPVPLSNFQRQITIVPATNGGVPNPTLSIITVTVRNNTSIKSPRDYIVIGYISKYK